MVKSIGIAIWACLVMFGASFGVGALLKSHDKPATAAGEASAGSETRKTKELNVPILRDGAVKGYVLLQLSYVVDLNVAKSAPVSPDAFVVDEAFRYIFDDESIDFSHLDKIEIDKLARSLMYKVNTRMKAPILTDMGVLECNFLLNAEAKVEGPLHDKP